MGYKTLENVSQLRKVVPSCLHISSEMFCSLFHRKNQKIATEVGVNFVRVANVFSETRMLSYIFFCFITGSVYLHRFLEKARVN